jgi:hypothetical protein
MSVYLRTGAAASVRNPSGGRRGFRAAWPRRPRTAPPRRRRDSALVGDTFKTDASIRATTSWTKLLGGSEAQRALPKKSAADGGRQTLRRRMTRVADGGWGPCGGRLGRPRWARARKPRRPQRRIARAMSVYLRTGAAASVCNPSGGRRGFRAAWPRRPRTAPPAVGATRHSSAIRSELTHRQHRRLLGKAARRLGGSDGLCTTSTAGQRAADCAPDE